MVAVAHGQAVAAAHGGDAAEVYVGRRSGILGGAVQQGDEAAVETGAGKHADGIVDLGLGAHAGRHYHRPPHRGDFYQVGIVCDLARGYLPQAAVHRREQLYRGHVEGSRQILYAAGGAVVAQAAVLVKCEREAAQHVELRAGAVVAGLVGGLWRCSRHCQLGHECLEFDDVGAGLGGVVDQAAGQLVGAVVIHAGLGDYECAGHG